jgi:hypothetical protein
VSNTGVSAETKYLQPHFAADFKRNSNASASDESIQSVVLKRISANHGR